MLSGQAPPSAMLVKLQPDNPVPIALLVQDAERG
jgi:hypothetical protein